VFVVAGRVCGCTGTNEHRDTSGCWWQWARGLAARHDIVLAGGAVPRVNPPPAAAPWAGA
jgi:hypothetical protein